MNSILLNGGNNCRISDTVADARDSFASGVCCLMKVQRGGHVTRAVLSACVLTASEILAALGFP